MIPECAIVFITCFCKTMNMIMFGKKIIKDAAAEIPCEAIELVPNDKEFR